jgi:hypothetical protein
MPTVLRAIDRRHVIGCSEESALKMTVLLPRFLFKQWHDWQFSLTIGIMYTTMNQQTT